MGRAPGRVPWTDEETQRAIDMWHEGKTAAEIGKILKRSRSSIIGRLHRKGCSNEAVVDTRTGQIRPRAKVAVGYRDTNVTPEKIAARRAKVKQQKTEVKQQSKKLEVLFSLPDYRRKPQVEPEQVIETPIPKGFVGVTLIDLEPHQCRYPVGEGAHVLFCGQRTEGGSQYCPECYPICYRQDDPYVRR